MVVFLIHRSNYYKLLGPLMEEALRRGLDVEIWIFKDSKGKAHLDPSQLPLALASLKAVIRHFQSQEQVAAELEATSAKAIFSLHSRSRYKLTNTKAMFITLQHGIDTFAEVDLENLCNTDKLCLYSAFWLDWGARYYQEAHGVDKTRAIDLLQQKAVLTGFPQMDTVYQLEPKEVRKKYGLAEDQKVVLYLPITLGNINGLWPRFFEADALLQRIGAFWRATRKHGDFGRTYIRWLLSGWNDRKLAGAIRAFAKNNDAVLIAKARQKDPLRLSVIEQADLALYDEEHYPSTTLELLSIADVCVQFYSFAALESAYCGVYGLTIDRPSPVSDVGEPEPVYHRLWRTRDEGSAFNAPGVNMWMTIPDVIQKLPGLSLTEMQINTEMRADYIERFMGSTDGKASERILDLVTA